jgi:hypothetical protein
MMQADAYAGYDRLYDAGRRPGSIVEAGCWAHARRKFFDLARLNKAPIAIEWASSPGPARPRAIGCDGAGGWVIRRFASQPPTRSSGTSASRAPFGFIRGGRDHLPLPRHQLQRLGDVLAWRNAHGHAALSSLLKTRSLDDLGKADDGRALDRPDSSRAAED